MGTEEEVDIIGSIRSALVAYWLFFAGAVVFFLILGFLYLRYTSPTFSVSAKILVKDDKKTDHNFI